jgi:chemotaxis protein MotB
VFWLKRLNRLPDSDSSWVLSYGDLMTLVLTMFVMIAAMSELHPGERFNRMSQGVREAFGYRNGPRTASAGAAPAAPLKKPPTLLERLEQAGFARRSTVGLVGPDDAVLAPCDVVIGSGTVTLRIAGHASFARGSAIPEPAARKALERLAGFLADGRNRLEIRGHADDEPLPAGAPFRDGMDLSYARARAAADILTRCGVARERLFVTAWDSHDPLPAAETAADQAAATSRPALPDGEDRRIELVVHAASAVEHVKEIAGKDGKRNG